MIDQNYDRWKNASPPENDDVSPCCGCDYEEVHTAEDLIYICLRCDEEFDEPEPEYEYEERMRENWEEMKADEERLERKRPN